MDQKIGIIGLGYVGLPLALAFAKKFSAIGFDVNEQKVRDLQSGIDRTGEISKAALKQSRLKMTCHLEDLRQVTFYVVAVPTPVDGNHKPDLLPLVRASELVGQVLKKGDVVVFESTVYPGVTEEVCGPVLAKISGLRQGSDFKLGYSPERINPGDTDHALERIVKVVSGEDRATLDRIARIYGSIITAGLHRASSIRVAEAAKVIENTQRDLNIALMNELAIIFDRLGISTREVLRAASTKWNFLPFKPGLVGGHCIGVDPYYLTTKAEEVGYHPQIILAGRRINDGMGAFIAQRLVKLLIHANLPVKKAKVGILGLTFKENVTDLRNSKVADVIGELQQFEIDPLVHDPIADAGEAKRTYRIHLIKHWQEMVHLDAMILAVSHDAYLKMGVKKLLKGLRPRGVLIDVKSILDPEEVKRVRPTVHYWSL